MDNRHLDGNREKREIAFRSYDGTDLSGTLQLIAPDDVAILLVHGLTVDRHEDGFYDRVVDAFVYAGFTNFGFDLRGHGKSAGTLESLTLNGVMSDIESALNLLRTASAAKRFYLVGSSFSGGLAAMVARDNSSSLAGVVLFNPLLDYRRRLIESQPFWDPNRSQVTEEAKRALDAGQFVRFNSSRPMQRALFNEAIRVRPDEGVPRLPMRVLVFHGTADSRTPFDVAQSLTLKAAHSEFVAVEGADHGLCWPGDDDFSHPTTRQWHSQAAERVVTWINTHASS